VLCAILIITGDLGLLADTTVMLLLTVFAVVNVAVLVLRKDEVDHDHYRTMSFAPVLGAIVSLILITQNEAAIFLRAGILLVLGAILYGINRALSGPHQEVDAEGMSG